MNIEKALDIARDCARAKRIAGLQADVPYSQAQLCDVIATILENEGKLHEEVTLANRRYAAANARYMKLAKKTGQVVDEE